MGYFQVRYDSRVVNYDRRGFIRLTTDFFAKNVWEPKQAKEILNEQESSLPSRWRLTTVSAQVGSCRAYNIKN